MRKPISRIRRWLFRAPIVFFRLRLGWLFGRRLLMLTHEGRSTGRTRRTVLEVPLRDAAGAWYLASGWGKAADWYQNLAAHPHADVTIGTRRRSVLAELLTPSESGALMVRYSKEHPKLAVALAKTVGWGDDGPIDWYGLGHDQVPWVRLTTR